MGYPRSSDVNSRDGDGIAPITALSKGRVSTAEVNNRKKNFFPFGTVCVVSCPHIKGSDLLQAAREQVMYCVGRTHTLIPTPLERNSAAAGRSTRRRSVARLAQRGGRYRGRYRGHGIWGAGAAPRQARQGILADRFRRSEKSSSLEAERAQMREMMRYRKTGVQ